jgi:hypothetical protein
LPSAVIDRSTQILANLEGGELDARGRPRLARGAVEEGAGQLALALGSGALQTGAESQALAALRSLDVERTTPLEALVELGRLRRELTEEGEA